MKKVLSYGGGLDSFAMLLDAIERKPPTKKNGVKLSIMGFSSKKLGDGTKSYKATPLPTYVAKAPREAKPKPCGVCGAAEKATKATGCGYLDEVA